jgi:hypothetical protein
MSQLTKKDTREEMKCVKEKEEEERKRKLPYDLRKE